MEFTTVTNGTFDATTFRSGAYAGRVTSLASATARGFLYQFVGTAAAGPYYVRFYFRYATLPSADNTIFAFDNDTTVGETASANINLTSTGTLKLEDGISQVGSDSAALSVNTWHMIEILFDSNGGPGASTLTARLDGVQFATSSALSFTVTTVHSVSFGGNLDNEVQTTGDWYFDDIAINDSTGSFQNSWPGSGKVVYLRPDGAGEAAEYSRGGADSGANWSQVEEIPPNDATDNVTDNVLNEADAHEFGASPSDTGTVAVVHVGFRFNASSATSTDPDQAVLIEEDNGGTLEYSANIDCSTTTWNSNAIAAPRNPPLTLYDLPGGSTTAWTKTTLDTLQAGYQIMAGDADNGQVTAIWVIVDYVVDAATTSTSRTTSTSTTSTSTSKTTSTSTTSTSSSTSTTSTSSSTSTTSTSSSTSTTSTSRTTSTSTTSTSTSTSTTSTSSSTSTTSTSSSTSTTSTSRSTSTSTTSTSSSTSQSTSTSTTSTSSSTSTSTTSTSSSTSQSTSTSTTSTSSSTSITNSITTSTSTTSTSSSTSQSTSTSTTSTSRTTSTSTTSTSRTTSSSTSTTSTSTSISTSTTTTSRSTSTSTTSTSRTTSTSTTSTSSSTSTTNSLTTSTSSTSISTSSSTTQTVPYPFEIERNPQNLLDNRREIPRFTVEKVTQNPLTKEGEDLQY